MFKALLLSVLVGLAPANASDTKLVPKPGSTVTGGGGGSGTVTSVAMTVPSFLSVSGSPVTTTGTLAVTLSGTALPILNGGTGQTTAANAINALLPTQTGNAGEFLTTDGSVASWAPGGSGATTALDNLAAVQMNSGLFFAVGTNGFLRTDANPGGSTTDLQIGTGDAGAGNGGALILTTGSATGGNSQNIYLQTGTAESGFNGGGIDINAASATGAGNAGNVAILAGNAEDGPAGSITLTPGTESGAGTPGAIRFLNSNEGTAGHVWTSTDTNGNGAWAAAGGGMDWSVPIDSNITVDTADTYDIGSSVAALASIYTNFVRSNNSLGIVSGANIEITGGNDAIYLYATAVAPSVFFYDDTTSFAVAVKAPSALVADTLFQFPPDNGTAGYVLSTDGNGVTSWIAAGSAPDPLLLSDGSATDPSYSFTTEDDTGMFLSAANIIGFAAGGSEQITIRNTGIYPTSNNTKSNGAITLAWTESTSYLDQVQRTVLYFGSFASAAAEFYGFVSPSGNIIWGLRGLSGQDPGDAIGIAGGADVSSGSTVRAVRIEAQNNTSSGDGGVVALRGGDSASGSGGGVQIVTPGAKPTCASGHRGKIWHTLGGTGVPDTFEVCAKDTLDAYAWYAMATIP